MSQTHASRVEPPVNLRTAILPIFLMVMFVAAGLAGGYVVLHVASQVKVVATLDCGKERKIELSIIQEEITDELYYKVLVGDRVVVPVNATCAFVDFRWQGNSPKTFEDLEYHVLMTKDGNVAGVFAKQFPYSLVTIHDFATGESWPHDHRTFTIPGKTTFEILQTANLKKQALRERLERDHPQVSYAAMLKDRKYLASKSALSFGYTKFSDEDMKHLDGLSQLCILHLYYTKVTDTGVAQLAKVRGLTHLSLSGTAITDESLATIANMEKLAHLSLLETRVTKQGVEKLKSARPDISVWRDEDCTF